MEKLKRGRALGKTGIEEWSVVSVLIVLRVPLISFAVG